MSGRYYPGSWWGRPAVLDQSYLPPRVTAICECRHDAEDLASLMNHQNKHGARMAPDAVDDPDYHEETASMSVDGGPA